MTHAEMMEMVMLDKEIKEKTERLNELKAKAREEANGQGMSFHSEGICIDVAKPGKPSVSLDTAKFKAKAPKLYAEVMEKYSKAGSPKAPAVSIRYEK